MDTKIKESEIIELKQSVGEWKEIVETACAFANTLGGKIYVGIADSGKVIGTSIGKGTIEDIRNKIINNTEPRIYPSIETDTIENKTIIIIEIKALANKFVLAFGRPYKRFGKSTIRISKDEYEKAIIQKYIEEIRFDIQTCAGASMKDIDKKNIKNFLIKAKDERRLDMPENLPPKETLMRLKLIEDNQVTNAAILLFGRNPQDYFLQSEIKCVRFKGQNVADTIIDMRNSGGTVIEQVIDTEKFIYDHISLNSWIEEGKIERQEKWEYPPKAIREALANAIAHRDYRSSSFAQIRIFDDRIEFWNPGVLPGGWTVETLKKKHESRPFNPLIARSFFQIKYIEEVGTGTNKIIEWCKEWELPEPDFEFNGSSIIVTMRITKLTDEYLKSLSLSEREQMIIEHIKIHGKITSNEIQNMFSVSRMMAYRYLKKLLNMHAIERKGTGKAIYYSLKIK